MSEEKLKDAEGLISAIQSLTLTYRTKWTGDVKPKADPTPQFTASPDAFPTNLKWTMGKKGEWEWAFALNRDGSMVEKARPLVDLIADKGGSVELGDFVYIHKAGGTFINRKRK